MSTVVAETVTNVFTFKYLPVASHSTFVVSDEEGEGGDQAAAAKKKKKKKKKKGGKQAISINILESSVCSAELTLASQSLLINCSFYFLDSTYSHEFLFRFYVA